MRKAVNHLKKSDPVMGGIIAKVGACKIQYREPVFDTLVRSIVYQQLSGKAAGTILGRLLEAAKVDPMTPAAILKLRPERMRKLGLSQQKMAYIRDLARLTNSGAVDFLACPDMNDDEVIQHLTQVKGVGVWTAQMFLIFALRRTDVLPTGDLGVRSAMKLAYELETLPSPEEMRRIAAPWRPYSSVASWYLWRSLSGEAAI